MRKFSLKKILLIVMCLLFALVPLSGCNRGEDGPSDDEVEAALENLDITTVEENLRILLPGVKPNDSDYVISKVNEKLKSLNRKYTISIKYEGWADYWNKVPMGVDKYDMFGLHSSYLPDYYSQRYLANLTPYINKLAPELKASTPQATWDAVTMEDKIVAIPRVGKYADPEPRLSTRSDFFEGAQGKDVKIANPYTKDTITTVQDYKDYTKAVKQYIDAKNMEATYVVDSSHNYYLRREYAKNLWFPLGQYSTTPIVIDVSKKVNGTYKVESWYAHEGFKEIARLNREEYLAKYKTSTQGQVADQELAFRQGKQAIIWDLPYTQSERIDNFVAEEKNEGVSFVNFYLNPDETKWIYKASDNSMAVYNNTSLNKTAVAVDFMNLLRKDRTLSDLLFYGEEGRNYNLEGEKVSYEGIPGNKKYLFGSMFMDSPETKRFSTNMTDAEIEAVNNWDSGENVKVSPLNGLNFTIKGRASIYLAGIQAVDSTVVNAFMYGSSDIDEVESNGKTKLENFLELIAEDMNGLIAELQKQVDEYCKANNI